jgi:hypothetical protein
VVSKPKHSKGLVRPLCFECFCFDNVRVLTLLAIVLAPAGTSTPGGHVPMNNAFPHNTCPMSCSILELLRQRILVLAPVFGKMTRHPHRWVQTSPASVVRRSARFTEAAQLGSRSIICTSAIHQQPVNHSYSTPSATLVGGTSGTVTNGLRDSHRFA